MPEKSNKLSLKKTPSGAIFSSCRTYRYLLWRIWDAQTPLVHFIGLNPSQADEHHNDPTIRRCIQFTRDWGYGGFYITNLYAYCHKSPQQLFNAKDPVGPLNNQYLRQTIAASEKTILIWGNHGIQDGRNQQVLELIPEPWCLKINKTGQPAHPLYLRKNSVLRRYEGRE